MFNVKCYRFLSRKFQLILRKFTIDRPYLVSLAKERKIRFYCATQSFTLIFLCKNTDWRKAVCSDNSRQHTSMKMLMQVEPLTFHITQANHLMLWPSDQPCGNTLSKAILAIKIILLYVGSTTSRGLILLQHVL